MQWKENSLKNGEKKIKIKIETLIILSKKENPNLFISLFDTIKYSLKSGHGQN